MVTGEMAATVNGKLLWCSPVSGQVVSGEADRGPPVQHPALHMRLALLTLEAPTRELLAGVQLAPGAPAATPHAMPAHGSLARAEDLQSRRVDDHMPGLSSGPWARLNPKITLTLRHGRVIRDR
jgi:hypothetical protein